MTSFLNKTALGVAALLTLTGGIAATTTEASAGGRGGAVAAGVIGGLAVGAIAGSALSNANQGYGYGGPGYGAPAYAIAPPQPVYDGGCYFARQPVYDEDGEVIGHRRVRVCQ